MKVVFLQSCRTCLFEALHRLTGKLGPEGRETHAKVWRCTEPHRCFRCAEDARYTLCGLE
jgi:hypothetical protein